MSKQYFSFDELKGELGLSEDEIKRMVSEGELRAFRDEDTMKFKREDVEALRRSRGGGMDDDDIILLDDDVPAKGRGRGDLTEELVLEDDDDFRVGGRSLDTQDTFVEGEVGGITEPIEVIDDDDESDDMPPAVATSSRRMAQPRGSQSRRTQVVAAPAGTPWVTGVQVVLCAVLLYGGAVLFGLTTDRNTPATNWLSAKVYEMFHKAPPAKRSLGER